ncbi:MAG: hypothetical protein ACETWQ_14190 [Phycisphaerae bacterium]
MNKSCPVVEACLSASKLVSDWKLDIGCSRKNEFGFPQGGVPSSFYDKHRYEPRPVFDKRDEHRQP